MNLALIDVIFIIKETQKGITAKGHRCTCFNKTMTLSLSAWLKIVRANNIWVMQTHQEQVGVQCFA